MGRLCYLAQPSSHWSWYFSREIVPVSRQGWRTFCCHGTNFIACWRDRGTTLIGAANLSPVTKLIAGTGSVSRYKLSRSQEFITVQDFNGVQISVSKCNYHYESVLGAEVKTKSVTNNLPLLYVLAIVLLYLSRKQLV
jgi:hypothetical protein